MRNGIDIFVDSSIFIYWLNGSKTAAEILSQNIIHYSIITEKIKGHVSLLQDDEVIKLQTLLNRFQKVGLTEDIKDLAITLRTRHKLKTPDAIIAPVPDA